MCLLLAMPCFQTYLAYSRYYYIRIVVLQIPDVENPPRLTKATLLQAQEPGFLCYDGYPSPFDHHFTGSPKKGGTY